MDPFATSHLSDKAVLHELKTGDAQDRRTIAVMLSRLAEAEERKLYLQEGYSSLYAYCVDQLHWCEGTASWRIFAARAARRFPVLFVDIAEGRLHLTAVVKLAKHLTSGNLDELRAAATHKSRAEIERLIAERFPRPDVPEVLRPIASPAVVLPSLGQHWPANAGAPVSAATPLAPERALGDWPAHVEGAPHPTLVGTGPDREHWPANAPPPAPRSALRPVAPERFEFQSTFDRETHDLLRDVRALLSREIPTGEAALLLKYALKLTKAELLKRKHAITDRPRHSWGCKSARTIPAAVKCAVWERDGGQCAFVSASGRRCEERGALEYDHIEPVARGGTSTLENVRLLCRAHNQHAAEVVFGREFMERKRTKSARTR